MKKILLSLLMIVCVSVVACARDKYVRDPAVLPTAAQSVLKAYFKADVSIIKIDRDFGRISEYDVLLTDGTEVKFDRSGNWEEIEVKLSGSVSLKLLPAGIASYVKSHHKGAQIIGVERTRRGFDVELSNGIEMKFSAAGQFLRYDD